MATLPLKTSRKGTAFCYLFSMGKRTAQMTFTLRCVQYMVTAGVLQDQQGMFGVRSLLVDEKALLMKKTWPMCCFDD